MNTKLDQVKQAIASKWAIALLGAGGVVAAVCLYTRRRRKGRCR